MASPPPNPMNQIPRSPRKRIIPKRPAPPPPTQIHIAQNPRDLGLTQTCLPTPVRMTAPSPPPALSGVVQAPQHLDRLPVPPGNARFAAQPSQTPTPKTKARHCQLSKTLPPRPPHPEREILDEPLRVQGNPQVINKQNRCNRNNRKKKLTKEDISAPTLVSASAAIIRHGRQIRIADRDPNDCFYGALFDDVKKLRRLKIADRPLPIPKAVAPTSPAVTVSTRTMSPPPSRAPLLAPKSPAVTVSRQTLSPPTSRAPLLAPISPAVTVPRRSLPPAPSRALTLPCMYQNSPSPRLTPSPAFLDRPPKAPSTPRDNTMTRTEQPVRMRIPPPLPLSIEEPHSFPVSVWITRQTNRQTQQSILHPVHVNGSNNQQPHLQHTSNSGGSECLVCIEEEAEVVFLECGHMVSCAQCSQRLEMCPLCRATISRKMTVSMC